MPPYLQTIQMQIQDFEKKGASTLHNVRIRTPWVERPGAVGSTICLYYHLNILAWIYSKMLYIRGLDFYTLYNCMFRKGCYSSFSKKLISLFWVLHLQFPHIRSWNFSLSLVINDLCYKREQWLPKLVTLLNQLYLHHVSCFTFKCVNIQFDKSHIGHEVRFPVLILSSDLNPLFFIYSVFPVHNIVYKDE